LTVLGIVIGVAAVITMVTLGGGATAKVTGDISKLGSNMLTVMPGQGHRGPGGARSEAPAFKMDDVTAIQREVSGLRAVAPTVNRTSQVIYGNQNRSSSITGSTNAFMEVRDWPLALGRAFTEGEIRAGQAVCILGGTVQAELFSGEDPLGKYIRLGKISFRVVGVLSSKGQSSFGTDQDDMVLIPLRTLQRRFSGNLDVNAIVVSAMDGFSSAKVQEDIEDLMRERRRIAVGKDDDFHVRDMKELISTLTSTTKVLTALLGAVAAVSLLVGGIGIMNIMLVSVTERTREIGIRMAVGARGSAVLTQFLVESVVMSVLGGVIGLALGFGGAALLGRLTGWSTETPVEAVFIAVGFSAAVGVFFGFYPARKAASLDPIQALRYE
jgi:putative ABC transport system permease protein